MKQTGTQQLVDTLLTHIHTATTLKEVSITLEDIAQDKHLKTHASNIVNDASLNLPQKKRQLSYIVSGIENPVVNSFLSDLVGSGELWLFDKEKIDYLDEFVKIFQLQTESVKILHLTTGVQLNVHQLRAISQDMSHDFGYKVIIKHEVNPSLLGGVQAKIDNYAFDFSLRTKFQQFQREWLASLEKTSKLVGRYDLEV
jgi:F0F1-type ATP synthase delta subunit